MPEDYTPTHPKLKVFVRLALTRITIFGYVTYALALLLLPLLWSRFGERQWLLIGLAYAPGILYLFPLLPLFASAALLKIRPLLFPSLLLLTLVFFGRMDFQFPRQGQSQGDKSLSVLSYNVRAGLGGREEITAYLKEQWSDLIGLQECRQPLDRRFQDPTPAILADMKSDYHFARGGHRGELVSLSRYPIVSSQEHDLRGYSPCLEIIVDIKGEKFRFLNVHVLTGDPKGILKKGPHGRTAYLNVTAQSRREQAAALLEVLAQSELPTILVGDFNSPPSSQLYRDFCHKLQDSFALKGTGFGLTYSVERPLWRIDYLWASPTLGVEACWVEPCKLSDHKPLAGRFRW